MQAWLALTRLYQGRWAEAGDRRAPIVGQPARGRHQPHHGAGGARPPAHPPRRPGRGGRAGRGAGAGRAHRRPCSASARCAPPAPRPPGWPATASAPAPRPAPRGTWRVHHRHPWHTGELGFWRWRAGERVPLPAWAARARSRARSPATGVARPRPWERLGCPYERARALADGDEPAQLAGAADLRPARRPARPGRLRQRLRAGGVRHIRAARARARAATPSA